MFQLSKKTIIFLVVFSVILIGITVGAIIYSNYNNTSDSSEVVVEKSNVSTVKSKTELVDDGVKGIDLNDRYKVNDLKFNNVEYTPSENSNYNITYFQISGLKDESIEGKINQEIKNKVFNIYDKYKVSDKTISNLSIRVDCDGNFADVLSMSVNTFIKYGENDYFSDMEGLNYRLDTGDEIKLKDLFTYDTSIKNILIPEVYKTFAWDYNNGSDYIETRNMNEIDYQDLEERVYGFVYNYLKNDNPIFSFTTNRLLLYNSNSHEYCTIKMADYYQNIAIYNRFVSDSNLYNENIYDLENIPVLTPVYTPGRFSKYYEDENCTIIFTSWDDNDYSFYNDEIMATIESVKKECLDSGRGIFYECSLSMSDQDNEKLKLNENITKYYSDKQYYKKYVYDVIIKLKGEGDYAASTGYYYVDENYVKRESDYKNTYLDKSTKKKITEEDNNQETQVQEPPKATNNTNNTNTTNNNNYTRGVDFNNLITNNTSNTTNSDVIIDNTTVNNTTVETVITVE